MSSVGKYSKFIVWLAGTVTIGLETQWPHASWVPWVTSLITAVAGWAVPNTSGTPGGGS